MQSLWLQWVSSPPSAGCPFWLPGAHTSYFEDCSGSRDKKELLASPLEPHLLVSPFSPGESLHLPFFFTNWKLMNIHVVFLRSNETSFAYLFRCCLTAVHGLHQGSWKHVMSNTSVFYCYATFQCFGLEMATWILLHRDVHMHLHDFSTQIFLTEISMFSDGFFFAYPLQRELYLKQGRIQCSAVSHWFNLSVMRKVKSTCFPV